MNNKRVECCNIVCRVDRRSLQTRVRTFSRLFKIVLGFQSVKTSTFGEFNSLICKWSSREKLNRSKEMFTLLAAMFNFHMKPTIGLRIPAFPACNWKASGSRLIFTFAF